MNYKKALEKSVEINEKELEDYKEKIKKHLFDRFDSIKIVDKSKVSKELYNELFEAWYNFMKTKAK